MQLKPNPFRPDKPVTDFDLFAGRSDELKVLIDSLFQTGHGNARRMIVTGPRGIGKSSFINQIKSLTDDSSNILQSLDINAGEFSFRFIVFKHVAIAGQSLEHIIISLIRKMHEATDSDVLGKKLQRLLETWKPTINVPILGLGVEYQPPSASEISTDFVGAVEHLWSELAKEKNKANYVGIIFIIDEIDTVAEDTKIASFLKVMSEELYESGLDKVGLYLVGITGAMEELKKDHPSVERVFQTIELLQMRPEESREVITRALRSTEESKKVQVPEPVMEKIIDIASGFPALIHTICYEAYQHNSDGKINEQDLEYALNEVITRIKRNELDQLFRKAGSGNYRKIVIAMAAHEETNVPLADIASEIGRATSAMSSYMTALRTRKIIDRVDRAVYRFVDPLLKLYVQNLDVLKQPSIQKSYFEDTNK